MRLMVSSLPADFDKYALQRLFSPFGWVSFAKVYYDPITMRSTRKGLVEMEDPAQARAAMEALQGRMLGQNPLKIKEAKEKQ
ncbi:RNA recognition motif domain-containing protein [Deminuibacter soli]|uniref:RNA-binding protein n=1 Tax=Deminuibacter soli TaxID=2291815 RepID=A0A3E1NM68_9BACT|nr:RNA-binding protein [Deminuibacter soli]RFM29023.1 RNA-binding protein [Deminuibacter soli]